MENKHFDLLLQISLSPWKQKKEKTHKFLHVSQEDSIQLRLKIMKSYIFNIPV